MLKISAIQIDYSYNNYALSENGVDIYRNIDSIIFAKLIVPTIEMISEFIKVKMIALITDESEVREVGHIDGYKEFGF